MSIVWALRTDFVRIAQTQGGRWSHPHEILERMFMNLAFERG